MYNSQFLLIYMKYSLDFKSKVSNLPTHPQTTATTALLTVESTIPSPRSHKYDKRTSGITYQISSKLAVSFYYFLKLKAPTNLLKFKVKMSRLFSSAMHVSNCIYSENCESLHRFLNVLFFTTCNY